MAESAFTGYTSRGEYVDTVQITAEDGMTAVISTLGARLLDLRLVCGTSVVLRHASLPEIGNDAAFINAVVGRVANRIAHGRITRHAQMSGVRLARHDGEEHTLHGGTLSWDRRLFSVTEQTPQHVALHMWSPHGDNGFPSDVHVVVRYSFTAASQLVVRLATTNVGSISTITNMTVRSNHNTPSFFPVLFYFIFISRSHAILSFRLIRISTSLETQARSKTLRSTIRCTHQQATST